jgi:hypothetical protein
MLVRNVGKWACMLFIAWGGGNAVVACGGSGAGSVFVDAGAGKDSSAGSDDATTGNPDAPSLVGGDDGGPGSGDSGSGPCVAKTCTQLGYNCGKAVQCGQIIDCTGTGTASGGCTAPESCGGGGSPNQCGGASTADGGPVNCTPTTCAALGYSCGFASDGCGDALNCNPNDAATGCTPPQYCGGGGFNQCGGNNGLQPDGGVPCTPTTCTALGYDCGFGNDGCGGLLTCTSATGCPAPQFCGGGGFNQCGGNSGLGADGGSPCVPTTCAKLGFNCGPAGDGCGGLLNCYGPTGACVGNTSCGGGGTPGVCGNSSCTGLCLQQAACGAGTPTTIKGTVIAGTPAIYGTADPVPNVVVYIPNAPLQAFGPGVTCSQCGAEVTGSPLVETTTAFDGTFTLANVPSNDIPPSGKIPVVIQLGRWRRTFLYDIASCTTTQLGNLVMPHNKTEGDIPLTAISTGAVDSIECVLLKMGVDQAEFTPDTGAGRIHLYSTASDYSAANKDGAGASLGATTPGEAALMGAGGTFMDYDQILLPCWGARFTKTAAELSNLVTYANSGGHFFATHFSYSWLYKNNPFNTTAQWNVDHSSVNGPDPFTVQVPPTNPEGTVFTNWLHLVGAMPTPPTVEISFPRHDVNMVLLQSTDWIQGADPTDKTPMLLHYTFDTPVGQTNQCGHVIYSDFHVANTASSPATVFPAECDAAPLTAQEKILEFMIWDLASCVPGPPTPPTCTPITCMDQGISCGPAGDGCGNEIADCGDCTPPATCGGGGVAGKCGAPDGGTCLPKTCLDQGITCGPAGDGCGNEIANCGNCTPPATCGGGGVAGNCGFPDAGTCQPETCAQQNIFCGPAGDGCGNEIADCGDCTPPQTCGGGGIPGQCGAEDAGSCAPTSCAAQGIQCGTASDGCGNILQCPPCPNGDTCNVTTGKCVQMSQ